MMFISERAVWSGVFFATPVHHFDSGDRMNKSATMIATALLTLSFAGASMAAGTPVSATPVAADSTTPPAKTTHKHKKHKKTTTAPTTTK